MHAATAVRSGPEVGFAGAEPPGTLRGEPGPLNCSEEPGKPVVVY